MLDFTSALYLGMRHPASTLAGWAALTEGRPAALGEAPAAGPIARRLAALMGLPAALLYPSTLHLFLDLFDSLGDAVIYHDRALYPAVRWLVERAAGLGRRVHAFDRHDLGGLARAIAARPGGTQPVIVTTGLCPLCRRLDELPALLALAAAPGGCLVLDDTQALGLLGPGGGGAARAIGLASPHLVVVASLAKAFGAPVAVLAGAAPFVARVRRHGPTRWHSSPASAADLAAAERALATNARSGDRRRARVAALAQRLAAGLAALGLGAGAALGLPVQASRPLPRATAFALHAACAARKLHCLLQAAGPSHATLTFLVTARHGAAEIDEAIETLAAAQASLADTWEVHP